MIANLKRNIVFIALALLAWFGYGDLDKEKSKAVASARSALRPIEISDITPRDPPSDWVLTRDPYGLVIAVEKIEPAAGASPRAAGTPSRAPPGRATSVSAGSAGHGSGARGSTGAAAPAGLATAAGSDGSASGATLHPPVTSLAHWAEHAEALLALRTATSPAPPPEPVEAPAPPAELPPVQFTLSLQATLAQAGGGQARISGQTVEVGAALAGFDPYSPPVLRAVEGSVAVVTHRGKDYLLDLDHQAVITVGTPGAATGEAAAAPRTSGGMGGAAGHPRTASTSPPKAAAPSAATQTAAPAPGAPKKATYKARSYPGKPKS